MELMEEKQWMRGDMQCRLGFHRPGLLAEPALNGVHCPDPGQGALPLAPPAICSQAISEPLALRQCASPHGQHPVPLTQKDSGGAGEELQVPACIALALPGPRKGAQHGRARDLAGSR